MDYGCLLYEIGGDEISLPKIREAIEVELLCKDTVELRLDKLKNTVKNGMRISILP